MKYDPLIKVAFVRPPLSEHAFRGTGSYYRNLLISLKKEDGLEVTAIENGAPVGNFDIIHYPYFDPFFLTMPLISKKNTVVTVHDLIPLKYPDKFKSGIKGLFKWFIQKGTLCRSRHIITDSHSSKKDIAAITGFPEKDIRVIYLGIENVFRKISDNRILMPVLTRYQLNTPFILYVGDINWNKNIPGLIKALSFLEKENGTPQLALVGRGFVNNSGNLTEINKLISDLNLDGKIKRIADVPSDDLVALYNLAEMFILPSFDEGFGLPLLEAMACQTPVISSDRGSLAEISGRAVFSVDPNDSGQMGKAIKKLLKNKELRDRLVAEGILQSQKFTWEKTSRATVNVYKKILGIKEY